MTLTCIIIDDEQYVLNQLSEYINEIATLKLIKSYTSSSMALQEILQMVNKVDILFTDVEMPELSGLELAEKIRDKFRFLVLVSGHINYAQDGYKVQANDFLAKPLDFKKFKSTVNTITNLTQLVKPFIFVKLKEDKEIIKLIVEEIIYIEAAGNYITIHLKNNTITTLIKLSEIEERLKEYGYFIKIHKSFIVSTKFIEKFKNDFVYLGRAISLPVSTTYKNSIAEVLNS